MGSVLVLISVGAGKAGAIAIGISALIDENKNLRQLSSQIELDQGHLKNSIWILERQVDSLTEIVL